MCRTLQVHPSAYYKWLSCPESPRSIANKALIKLIRDYWESSEQTYGSPRIYRDLREAGATCSENHLARLMRLESIKAVHVLTKPRYISSKPSIVAESHLDRQFEVDEPDKVWVTDITQIRTCQGMCTWLY